MFWVLYRTINYASLVKKYWHSFWTGQQIFFLFFSQGYFYSFLIGNKYPSSSSRVCPWNRTWNDWFIKKQSCTESRTLKFSFWNSAPELTTLERNVKTFVLSPKAGNLWWKSSSVCQRTATSVFFLVSYLWLFLADENALGYYRIFFLYGWTLFLYRSIALIIYNIIYNYHCSRLTKSSSFEENLIKIFASKGWLAPKLLNRWKHCSLKSMKGEWSTQS